MEVKFQRVSQKEFLGVKNSEICFSGSYYDILTNIFQVLLHFHKDFSSPSKGGRL